MREPFVTDVMLVPWAVHVFAILLAERDIIAPEAFNVFRVHLKPPAYTLRISSDNRHHQCCKPFPSEYHAFSGDHES
jgi:hypothetical protein